MADNLREINNEWLAKCQELRRANKKLEYELACEKVENLKLREQLEALEGMRRDHE